MMLSKLLLAAPALLLVQTSAFLSTPGARAPVQAIQVTRSSATPTDTKNLLDVLQDEHHEALDMLKKMQKSDNPEECRILTDKTITLLVQHSIVEETLVYPLLSAKLDNGRDVTNRDKEEHHRLEELMRDLETRNPVYDDFNEAAKRLEECLQQHRQKEEKEQFPQLRNAVSSADLEDLVGKANGLKMLAPTHPHPVAHASHSAAFDTTVGSVVGLVDRVRDAITGRTTSDLDSVSRPDAAQAKSPVSKK